MNADIANIIGNGLVTGCIYALIGVGFVVVFRATGVVSFAQGAFMVLGALIFATVTRNGQDLSVGLIAVVLVMFLIGGLIYRLVFARLAGSEVFVTSIATVGLGIVLQVVALLVWGPEVIVVPAPFDFRSQVHVVGALSFSALDLFVMGLTVVVFALIVVGLQRTPTGLRMRAVANNPRLAAYGGVNVVRTSTLAWGIGAATAGLAGVVFLLGSQPDPVSVFSLGLAAFPAILLGGLDSIPGSLVGGILIGLLQASVGVYIGGAWQDVVSYCVLLGLLLIRPQGILGSVGVARL
ncbi:MAG: branched-chain amino acid transporter permease [Modestobacter sp.]|jgi:branched-chain amino acid transport system permease protein|nr:branched-chain amino acid transporter permease [Modestobacter sp.]MCW2578303.1 branched-chain amino acid transporter permease [Modestobacter sp.]MCW2620349.1 branched-chain amino acid transporter permease [Modestobacter sp.]